MDKLKNSIDGPCVRSMFVEDLYARYARSALISFVPGGVPGISTRKCYVFWWVIYWCRRDFVEIHSKIFNTKKYLVPTNYLNGYYYDISLSIKYLWKGKLLYSLMYLDHEGFIIRSACQYYFLGCYDMT